MSCVEQSVVLVMCGSFNPLTYTHLRVMEMSRDLLQYQGTKYLFTGLFSYTLYSKKSEYSLNRILSSSPFSEGGGYRSQLLAIPPPPYQVSRWWEGSCPPYMMTITVKREVLCPPFTDESWSN